MMLFASNEQIHEKCPTKVILAFGVHPWYAHLHEDHKVDPNHNWLTRLAEELKNHKEAIVGEIGLDKTAKVWLFLVLSLQASQRKARETGKNEFIKQMEVFKAQIQLAAELEVR